MTNNSRTLATLVVLAAGLLPTAAQAQYYAAPSQPAPLYPYVVQGNQPYAVEVAPNTYVIQRSAPARTYPYVRGGDAGNPAPEQKARRFDRPPKPADHTLIEELRKRHQTKTRVINTTKIVREPPVVVETERVVDDPPRVIERRHVVEDAPVRARRKKATAAEPEPNRRASRDDNKKRVIEADAEVTILGPDRMSIRLFRKGQGPKANARAE